ncbi:MAG: [FeFe] hydrogenase H-cluster radical SAM maturase HydG [Alphaproteobacteria bacterium]|nr:[FeFe] hydrogenase H-cluster radical SAM maturase HydG [Alphaproteobacteria bacterium]
MKSFIDHDEIDGLARKPRDKRFLHEALDQAESVEHKGLALDQAAALLLNEDPEIDDRIFALARDIKQRVYGNRVVLFAPLYVSNTCSNECLYCGFRRSNFSLKRKELDQQELADEVRVLTRTGHKRLLMVYGETNGSKAGYIADTVRWAYQVKTENSGEIRRINVNAAPMEVADFKVIKQAGIGTYQCFQETYHRPTYEKVHVAGKKADYDWRLYAMHRAVEGGIDDVGIGVLYGLSDYKWDTLAMLAHCRQLEKDIGVGPHTVSFPRIEPAQGSAMSENPPHALTDRQFMRVVAITRIAVPYTGIIMSTRENAEMRRQLIETGVSQISAGSRTYPGAYKDSLANKPDSQQFTIGDTRSLDDVVLDLIGMRHTPSFCTGCYRSGRTGDHFMGLAKTAFIHRFCSPNGILTFAEYLRDYGSEDARKAGKRLIDEIMAADENAAKAVDKLRKMESGDSDLFF